MPAARRDRSTARSRTRVAVAAVALVLPLAVASPAAADYPSWSDVQSAQHDQAATAAMVDTLEHSLDDAQTRAASLSETALDAAAAAEAARATADAAASAADALAAQSAAADEYLAGRRTQLGTVASGLYRTQADGALIARLLTSADPDSVLDRLGLLDRLTDTWSGLVADAQRASGTATSLRDRSAAARAAAEAAAEDAASSAAQAQSAADAESAIVAALTDQMSTMYAQLASLKKTTADIERQYRVGQQVAAQAAASPSATGGAASAGAGSTGAGSTGAGSTPTGGTGSTGAGSTGSGSSGAGTPTYGVVVDPAGAKAYARGALGRFGWGDDQYSCLVSLWNRESGWRANALNPSSGAYGIPQALPAEKMAAAGADWRTNGATQVEWGLSYIKGRYGSPCGAWAHSQSTGWY